MPVMQNLQAVTHRALGVGRRLGRYWPERVKRLLRALSMYGAALALWLRNRGWSFAYARQVAQEHWVFRDSDAENELPAIADYWGERWLRPELEAFGFSHPEECYVNCIAATQQRYGRPVRVVSLGCGNCASEIGVARLLRERDVHDFHIQCVDINERNLAQGEQMAAAAGLAEHIGTGVADLNHWQPEQRCDVVMANQILHHVVGLEHLFAQIERALDADGAFVTSDMIGRNGHARWPEAMAIVHEFWRELPASYHWNHQLRRRETLLEYWDCSQSGFEGVRAQDILPLLLEHFAFELFVGYGNLIDPFIDRGFGPNFDATCARDRSFIDRVHQRDERELAAGHITPTHMIAVLRKRPFAGRTRFRGKLSPAFCVRRTTGDATHDAARQAGHDRAGPRRSTR